MTEDFLARLAEHAELHRPEPRRLAGGIDISQQYALLFIDYASLPFALPSPLSRLRRVVVGVEIKPKWGFLPSKAHRWIAERPTKTTICRYCMHQELKYAQGAITERTAYCPLDLYSRSIERTSKGSSIDTCPFVFV